MRAAKLAALAVCLCGLASAALAEGPARVVILPVVVHSASPDPGYVSRGLSDMLSARLEQLGGVDVVRPSEESAATVRPSDAIQAAKQAGGDYVLFGSFTQFGDGASLDIQCAPVRGGVEAPRNIFIQSGSMGEIIPKLDELADKVARYVRGEEPEAVAAPAQNGAGSSEELEELKRRLAELERAVFPPVAEASEDASTVAEASEDASTVAEVAEDSPGS